MSIQLYVGVVTEGPTDIRFLNRIIESVFLNSAYGCENEVAVESIVFFDAVGDSFVQKMLVAAEKGALQYGISVLCIHTDQDGQDIYSHKINPFLAELGKMNANTHCKVVVPIIPVKMTEAWMLADTQLLRERIFGLNFTDFDLGIHRAPESYADPKNAIQAAINIVKHTLPKKRRNNVSIAELYTEIGNSISLEKLRMLPSFVDFETNVKNAFIKLHYLVE